MVVQLQLSNSLKVSQTRNRVDSNSSNVHCDDVGDLTYVLEKPNGSRWKSIKHKDATSFALGIIKSVVFNRNDLGRVFFVFSGSVALSQDETRYYFSTSCATVSDKSTGPKPTFYDRRT